MIPIIGHKSYIYWQQRLKEQGSQVLIPLLSLALILLTAQGAARLSWRVFDLVRPGQERWSSPTTAAISADSAVPVHKQQGTPVEELRNLHLFGRAGTVTGAAQSDARDLPQTTLRLSLIGVIFSSSADKAVAIIVEKGSTEEAAIFGVGDQLPGNAVLREIHRDRIILVRAGKQEVLLLDEGTTGQTADTVQKNLPRKGAAGRAAKDKPRDQGPIQTNDDDGNGTSVKIERDYLNQRLTDLQALASEINAEPTMVGDQQGYRLKAGTDSELLSQLGLKSGDVLVEVNGIPLSGPRDVMRAYSKAKDAENVQIQYIRDGKQQTMEYTIGQF